MAARLATVEFGSSTRYSGEVWVGGWVASEGGGNAMAIEVVSMTPPHISM